MSQTHDSAEPSFGMHEASRREKLRKIAELGHDPWGSRFDEYQSIADIRAKEGEIVVLAPAEPATETSRGKQAEERGPRVRAAGRIMLMRPTGKLIFLEI